MENRKSRKLILKNTTPINYLKFYKKNLKFFQKTIDKFSKIDYNGKKS